MEIRRITGEKNIETYIAMAQELSECDTVLMCDPASRLSIADERIFLEQHHVGKSVGPVKAGSFQAIGAALAKIRDKQLYRVREPNFYDYCLIYHGYHREAVDHYLTFADQPIPEVKTLRPPIRPSCIYFLRSAGLIKIGWTKNLQKRISAIQCMSAVPVTLIGTIEGTKADEDALHRQFASHRSHGEWFHTCEEIEVYIASVKPEVTR